MGKHRSKQQLKRAKFTEASSLTTSKRRPREKLVELQSEQRESESPLLPSSDSLEKINVPSASGANSDPSASSTSVNGNNYYVFLSFRGPDTRNGFVDHLYHRLNDVGLKFHPNFVFRDDKDLPFGEKIGENLISAIKHSKVSIPVISENYAASEWCLCELIQIMECKKTSGQIVLPVFYKVKPYEVRELQGAFGEVFKFGMHRFKKEDVKQKGPVALRELVDSRVFESEKTTNGREGELVNELVEIILRELQHDFQPHLPANLVAIEDRVAEVMELVDLACPDTRIIGIWGMGGIGKTTLAMIIYQKLFDNFQYRSSLKDIRETINREGIKHVQSLLLSDLRKDSKCTVRDSEMGINMIRLSCQKKKVLILLDDVDRQDQLDNLIGGSNFESGSRIIITCRDTALLDSEYKKYELKGMDYKDSMLLFSRYAFEGERPPTELEALSRDIVKTTGGLPLALTVIGSLLKRKNKSIWKEMLEKSRKMPHKEVQEKLKLSYDALEDNEKQMFLDIACFFIGTDQRIAIYLWEDLQLYPNFGLARMIELSLIKIDEKNRLRMHDQLRDLGRAIAYSEGTRPWLCSRLWGEEAIKVLRRKEENENIEALRLDGRGSGGFMDGESFKKVLNLKLLHLSAGNFAGDFEGSLAELRWLKWEGCSPYFNATNVHLNKLVVLDLSWGYMLSEYWRGWSSIKMENLKVLNLSRCFISRTPNLSAFENLKMLILEDCAFLKEIDPSIGDVKHLVSLNLRSCKILKKLPKQLGELKNLEELVVDHTQIQEIPPFIGPLKTLSAKSCLLLTKVPKKALDLRVFELEKSADGHEGELVNKLVEMILREQQHDFQPHLPMNLVGIDHRVAEVMKLVDIACPETRIIGIWGMGGIGKTTLAKIIYNKLFDKFKCRSFLKDIRETINRKGVKHVQSQLISDILKTVDRRLYDPDTGIDTIQSSCTQKKVLILLDDVDYPNHLDNLIGGCKFLLGSRIIFTSRDKAFNCQDKALLESTYWYELQKLNIENSLRLLIKHAFEKKPPPKQIGTLSRDIVAIIGGLPLLPLTVIGSVLKGEEDQGIWREMLEELRNVPDGEVVQQLMISYYLLEDVVKKMFLDIACFFIGIDKRIVPYLWDHKLYPRTGLKKLIDRSLIYVDDDNELNMHDEYRDLGRAIARPANKKLWDCSRLWDEEAMIVLSCEEENENIKALRLDERGSREFMERESFKKMPNLKFLHVKDVDIDGDFAGSLTELRWLKWERCHDCFEAIDFHLEKLVIFDLSGDYNGGNHISENWRGWSSIKMERLKVLNLSRCLRLKSTPNLSAFKNLEILILENCAYLEEIDPSIGYVKRLISLNMSHCKGLKKLPEQLGELENLEVLVVDETQIKEIPPCIGSLKKLKTLSAKHCLQPIEVPSSIVCLVSLSLAEYYKLQAIPSSIGKLGELVVLDLSYTGIKELPESIKELNKLKILRICGSRMERLPSSIGKLQNLQEVDANGCSDLEGQIHVDKGGFSSLKTLSLAFTKFSGLPENLDQLSSLKHLELLNCYKLQSFPKPPFSLSSLQLTCWSNELPSLSHLKNLKELTLWYCMSLQSIPELPSCIQTLNVEGCPKLERLPNLSDLKFLLELGLVECLGLKKLDGLEALKSLRKLSLSRNQLDNFDENADKLHAIEGLEKLGSLKVVDISGRRHIEVLDLSKSKHLKVLIVCGCKSLVEILCPSKYLERFDRYGCKSLKKFPDLLPDRARFLR